MCGPETSTKPRGGALAVLNPTSRPGSPTALSPQLFRGDLAFHTPGFPGSAKATHARWTLDSNNESPFDLASLDDLVVVIHHSGDLTRTPHDCGLFHQFAFSQHGASLLEGGDALEIPLQQPISLEVGNDGIIGRRVSVFSKRFPYASSPDDIAVAEGIVGFNFSSNVSSSL